MQWVCTCPSMTSGTGYSSRVSLQQFPIGTLKIDQSFVRDVSEDAGDATIVKTIIEMTDQPRNGGGRRGVESLRHLDFYAGTPATTRKASCFGEPCTAGGLLALLMRQASVLLRSPTCCITQTSSPAGRPD